MTNYAVITPIDGIKTVAATGTPEALVSTPRTVQSVELVPQKAQGTANTGTVYIGWQSGNGLQYRPIAPTDQPFAITAPFGSKLDLSQIYIDAATAGDGVSYVAIP
jgi:hypothetical protein